MDEGEKRAKRLLAQAAKDQTRVQQEDRRRRRPVAEPAPKRMYCSRCYAMLKADESCPKCDHGEVNYFHHCRKCLHVHGSLQACRIWTPGQCPHCKTVHADPLSDCPCRQCKQVHDGACGRATTCPKA